MTPLSIKFKSAACGLALLALSGLSAAQDVRPRVGLVLGGGGARGAAHIGVLEVLERLRVPVDCVAGTSMGALVAGAWVAGRSPAQLRTALAQADWDDLFQDNPDYRELDFRVKRLSQRFLPGTEAGIQAGGAVFPAGVVLGQKIKLFFNHLLRAETGEPLIEELPLPLSIVATDIGTGERVVYRDGSLSHAMRASMSVPGLIAPTEYRGRKLVDGGLVDNLPVGEVRERCSADVVIVVDVGTTPLPAEQVTGLFGVAAQVITLLTEQNVKASLASLKGSDVHIRPELSGIGSSDFNRHADAADRGRAAAEALQARLADLGVDEAQFADWRRTVNVRKRELPLVDEVQVSGLARVGDALVRRHFEQRTGEALDSVALQRDLMRTYGDGHYEHVDYTVERIDGRQVLRVMPVEKSWGPDYLRLGFQLDSNLSQGSSYQLRAGYQKTWLNRLGGEALFTAGLGSRTGVGAEFYQPVSDSQRWFVDAAASAERERIDYFYYEQRIAEYSTSRTRVELTAGLNLPRYGQLRAGWRHRKARYELETGLDIFSLVPNQSAGGWLLSLDVDRLDRLYFPSRGWALQSSWFDSKRGAFSMLKLDLRLAAPIGDLVFGGRAAWTGSTRGQLPLADAARLGGFLNLSGYATGQLIGDGVGYGQVRLERIIGRLSLGLRGDMRMGAALEAAKLNTPYTLQRDTGWLYSVAVYLGGETPVGPAYVGLGFGRKGATNAYLFIGTP